ncbi:hypothetical protein WT90_32845 [Burkholderia stagnalis]|nr:hypothetical protein WT90_32845 [Burkholderia stagnalis]
MKLLSSISEVDQFPSPFLIVLVISQRFVRLITSDDSLRRTSRTLFEPMMIEGAFERSRV